MARLGLMIVCFVVACTPSLEPGATCATNTDCPSPFVCADGRCRTECVSQRDCPLGTFCRLDAERRGSCALPDDPTCPATACAAHLLCVDDVCVNACTSVTECPIGSACVAAMDGRTRCVRADDGDAGPDVDAGPDCHGPRCDRVVQLSAGMRHVCARTAGGHVWCWGQSGGAGGGAIAIGDCGGNPCQATPVEAVFWDGSSELPIADAADVSGGENFTCVLRGDQPWCWGQAGTTGTGESDIRHAMRVRHEDGGFVGPTRDLSSARSCTLALTSDGSVIGWGVSPLGLLGDMGNAELGRTLSLAGSLPATTLMATGSEHACTSSGDGVACWGSADLGVLGRVMPAPTPGLYDVTPAPVAGADLAGAAALSAGDWHSCALVDGEAFCWGKRWLLGVFTFGGPNACAPDAECSTVPVRVYRDPASARFTALGGTAVAHHECALDADGLVRCWGDFDALDELLYEPHAIPLPGPAEAVTVGEGFSCAIVAGDVYCWGRNENGQLGRGAPGNRDVVPARVAFPSE